jgi:hypothetical protein
LSRLVIPTETKSSEFNTSTSVIIGKTLWSPVVFPPKTKGSPFCHGWEDHPRLKISFPPTASLLVSLLFSPPMSHPFIFFSILFFSSYLLLSSSRRAQHVGGARTQAGSGARGRGGHECGCCGAPAGAARLRQERTRRPDPDRAATEEQSRARRRR